MPESRRGPVLACRGEAPATASTCRIQSEIQRVVRKLFGKSQWLSGMLETVSTRGSRCTALLIRAYLSCVDAQTVWTIVRAALMQLPEVRVRPLLFKVVSSPVRSVERTPCELKRRRLCPPCVKPAESSRVAEQGSAAPVHQCFSNAAAAVVIRRSDHRSVTKPVIETVYRKESCAAATSRGTTKATYLPCSPVKRFSAAPAK